MAKQRNSTKIILENIPKELINAEEIILNENKYPIVTKILEDLYENYIDGLKKVDNCKITEVKIKNVSTTTRPKN